MTRPVAATVTLLLAACSTPVTEIVLEVRSDLEVPAAIDRVRVTAGRPGADAQVADADLTAEDGALPRTVTLVHAGGPLGPVDVAVTGRSGSATVVTRALRISFEAERSLRLVVVLEAACVGVPCPDAETCEGGACRSVDLGPCEIDGRSCGDAGGTADAGPRIDACVPSTEICNDLDDDCDGTIDEGFDLETDRDNCGTCGRVCPRGGAHAADAVCVDGSCALDCDPGWGDCNRDPADGCETDITADMAHCGGCGIFCPTAGTFHARDAVCSAGRCLLSCDADWGDCDDDPSTGCETHVSVDRNHCGTCDNPCPAGLMCRSSTCS